MKRKNKTSKNILNSKSKPRKKPDIINKNGCINFLSQLFASIEYQKSKLLLKNINTQIKRLSK